MMKTEWWKPLDKLSLYKVHTWQKKTTTIVAFIIIYIKQSSMDPWIHGVCSQIDWLETCELTSSKDKKYQRKSRNIPHPKNSMYFLPLKNSCMVKWRSLSDPGSDVAQYCLDLRENVMDGRIDGPTDKPIVGVRIVNTMILGIWRRRGGVPLMGQIKEAVKQVFAAMQLQYDHC